MDIWHFVYHFINWWIFGLFPIFFLTVIHNIVALNICEPSRFLRASPPTGMWAYWSSLLGWQGKTFPFSTVLDYAGCYNNNTIDRVAYKQQNLFLMVPVAGKFKIKPPADSVSDESLLHDLKTDFFSLCPHMAEGARACSDVFYKDTNLLYKARALMTYLITSLRLHLLILSHWVLEFNIWILGRHQHSVYRTYFAPKVLCRSKLFNHRDQSIGKIIFRICHQIKVHISLYFATGGRIHIL